MVDCLIVGGGPAGLTAGLYAARAGLDVLLLERVYVGGQIATTSVLENFPGFPHGVGGAEFGELLMQQAMRFGLRIEYRDVEKIDLMGETKTITTGGEQLQANSVILCMGAGYRTLGAVREEEFRGRGLSYCATCDGAFFKGKDVAVVGGGDTACEDALYLARVANKVSLIHRRDALRANAVLQERVRRESKIQIHWDTVVEDLHGEEMLTGIALNNVKTGQKSVLDIEGIFIAVGMTPHTGLVQGQLNLDDQGYIQTDISLTTSLPGVFAAGDIRTTPLRQVVTAVADGALAATSAVAYLSR